MNQEIFTKLLFEKAKSKNIHNVEVHMTKLSSMNINVFDGSLEKFVIAEENKLSVRGIYNGRMAYSYTEKLEKESLEELFNNLIQYAENNHNGPIEEISPMNDNMVSQTRTNNLDRYSQEEKINYLLDLEKRAYGVDKRVKTISQCSYRQVKEEVFIKNTNGLDLSDSHTIGIINLGAVTEEGGSMQTGYSHHVFNDFDEDYKDQLIKESIGDALVMLGAKSIEPASKKVILRNNVAADLFSNYLKIFYGSSVQKNLSLMKGKIGNQVAVEGLNIIEDPCMVLGKVYRTFDDEGTPTYKKHIIKDGILKTYLHNKKTGKLDGIESTGNAFRDSHKSSIGILPTNSYLQEGDISLDDMIKTMEDGVIITDIHGLHAGINPTSGDFSLSANGLLVEDGQIIRPIAQITVAGNFISMLNNIKHIGNDTKYCNPNGNYFGSPSICVLGLSISGK